MAEETRIIMDTTIPCNESPDCCGCLIAYQQDSLLVFKCNECNKEAGRGIVMQEIKKTEEPFNKPLWG